MTITDTSGACPPSRTRPLIRADADLLGVWTTLMSPLGFAEPALWLMVIGPDARPSPTLVELQRSLEPPGREHEKRLAGFLREVRHEAGGARLAPLLVRPGGGTATLDDRDWAAAVYRAGRLGGVPLHTVHLATTDRLCALPLDDVRDRVGA